MFLLSFSNYFSYSWRNLSEKTHRSQDFLFSSSWLPNTGKQGMQTWCNTFYLPPQHIRLSISILPIYCFFFFTIAMFPGLVMMETEKKKKLWTQQTLDNQEGCLRSTSSRLVPLLLPTNLHFHISVHCFFSKWNLVTQIVAFLYVAYKQREVSISAFTNFLLNNDLISLEWWDDLQRLDPRTNIYS